MWIGDGEGMRCGDRRMHIKEEEIIGYGRICTMLGGMQSTHLKARCAQSHHMQIFKSTPLPPQLFANHVNKFMFTYPC